MKDPMLGPIYTRENPIKLQNKKNRSKYFILSKIFMESMIIANNSYAILILLCVLSYFFLSKKCHRFGYQSLPKMAHSTSFRAVVKLGQIIYPI